MKKKNAMIVNVTTRVILVVLTSLLFLLIPHVNVDGFINSTVTSKFVYFTYGCIVLSVFYAIKLVSNKTLQISFTKVVVLLALMLLYITINRYYIQEIYGFSIRYMELLGLSVLYVILRSLYLKHYIWIVIAILLSGLVQAVYGNLQLLGFYASNHSGFKMTGSFFNPGPYAGFLSAVWPIALGMYLFKKKILKRFLLEHKINSKLKEQTLKYALEYIPLLTLISIALVTPASRSRAAWLAVIISSACLLELRYAFVRNLLNRLSKSKKILLLIVSALVFLVALFGIYHFKKGSSDGRLFIWKVSSGIVKDFPVFGVGFDRFKAHYMNYQGAYFKEHGDQVPEVFVADNTSYAFNEFLQFFVENGIVGLMIWLGITFLLFRIKVAKENKELFWISMFALVALGVFAFFSYSMEILSIKLVGVFVLSLLVNSSIKKKSSLYKLTNYKVLKSVIGLAFLFVSIKQVHYTQKLASGFKDWNEAIEVYNRGYNLNSEELFQNIYSIFLTNEVFLFDYGKILSAQKK